LNNDAITDLLSVINDTVLAETGGGHGQKGIDFQRYWTIHRMIELENSGVEDFLILIEAVQDVAELDSCTSPTSICLYQVKKKDRKEWSWNELTKLKKPNKKKNNDSSFKESPLGKLYATFIAFGHLNVSCKFISNRGCDIPLETGKSAATSLPSSLNHLSEDYKQLIREKMAELSTEIDANAALPNIYLEKVAIPPDDPKTHVVGFAHQFLKNRSPRHAGQASSFVEALMAIIGPLGARTDACNTFDELCCLHGFSRTQFSNALGDLEKVPDILSHLEFWLEQLRTEGIGIMEITSIRTCASTIFRKQVIGIESKDDEENMLQDIDKFLKENAISNVLKPVFEEVYNLLSKKYSNANRSQIFAQFAIRAIKKCVDQI